MKTKNRFALLIILGLLPFRSLLAQSSIEEPKFIYKSHNHPTLFINSYFDKNYKDKKEIYTCDITFSTIKFKLDKDGKVKDVQFALGTPEALKIPLEASVKATNGHWTPRKINSKPVESREFILPVLFNLTGRCEPQDAKQDFGYGIWNMLLFENKYDTTRVPFDAPLQFGHMELDCILLQPLYIVLDTQYYSTGLKK